jgi:hypothetical protein
MFGNLKNKLAVAAVVAAGAVALPSVASAATATPALPSGAVQAFGSTNGTTPITAPTKRNFSGRLTMTVPGVIQVTCTVTASVTINVDGTTLAVPVAPFTNCVTNVAGCTATAGPAAAPNNTWGNRLIRHIGPPNPPAAGMYDIINVAFTNTFSGTCPVPTGVPIPESGLLYLSLTPAPGPVTAATVTAPFNTVSGGASATVSGSLGIVAGQPSLFVI